MPRGRGNYALNFRLTADSRQLSPELRRARRDLGRFVTDVRATIGRAARITAGIAAGAVAGVAAIGNQARQQARDLRRFSTVAGVSQKEFQSFGFAVEQFGGNLKDAETILADFQTRLVELQRGESTATEAFAAIGLSAERFLGQKVPEAFDTFIQAARESATDLIVQQTAIDDLFSEDRDIILQIIRRADTFETLRRRIRDVTGEVADAAPIWDELSTSISLLGNAVSNNFNRALVDSLGGVRSFDDLIRQAGAGVYTVVTAMFDGIQAAYRFRDAITLAGFALAGAFITTGAIRGVRFIIGGLSALLQAAVYTASRLGVVGLFSFILTPVGATLATIGAVLAAILIFRDEVTAALEDLGIDLDDIGQRIKDVIDPQGEGLFRAAVGDIHEGILAIRERIFGPLPNQLGEDLKSSINDAADVIRLPEIEVTASPDSRTFIERMTDRMGEFVGQFGDLNQFAATLLDKLGLPSLGAVDLGGEVRGIGEELERLRGDLQRFEPGGRGDDDLSTGPGPARDRPNVFSLQVPERSAIFDDLGDQLLFSFQGGIRNALLRSGNVFQNLGDFALQTLADGLFRSATQQLATLLKPFFDALGSFISIGLQSLIGGFGGAVSGVTNPALAGSRSPLGFQEGGFIPGPTGAPRMVIAHGGELVLNAAQQDALLGGVTVQVTQQVFGDPTQEQRRALLRNASELTDIVQARLQERRVLR